MTSTRSISAPLWARIALASAAVSLLLACSAEEPVQTVAFNGRINIGISPDWVPSESGKKSASYQLAGADDIHLEFQDQTSDFGTPMTVQGVRSAVGSELNSAYGRVNARLSFGGNAVLTYPRETKHGREEVYTHNWVVAKPFGHSAVARVAITLRVPVERQNDPTIQAIVEQLDKQVGDAVMPVS